MQYGSVTVSVEPNDAIVFNTTGGLDVIQNDTPSMVAGDATLTVESAQTPEGIV